MTCVRDQLRILLNAVVLQADGVYRREEVGGGSVLPLFATVERRASHVGG